MGRPEMRSIAALIDTCLSNPDDAARLKQVEHDVPELCRRFSAVL